MGSHGRQGVQPDEASALVNENILPVKCRLTHGVRRQGVQWELQRNLGCAVWLIPTSASRLVVRVGANG